MYSQFPKHNQPFQISVPLFRLFLLPLLSILLVFVAKSPFKSQLILTSVLGPYLHPCILGEPLLYQL